MVSTVLGLELKPLMAVSDTGERAVWEPPELKEAREAYPPRKLLDPGVLGVVISRGELEPRLNGLWNVGRVSRATDGLRRLSPFETFLFSSVCHAPVLGA